MDRMNKQAFAEEVAQRVMAPLGRERYGVALMETDAAQSKALMTGMKRYGYDPYWLAEKTKDFVVERFAKELAKGKMNVVVLVRAPWESTENAPFAEADYEYFRALARRTFLGYRREDEMLKDIVEGYDGNESADEVMVSLAGLVVIDLGWQEGRCFCHSFANPKALFEDDEVTELLVNVVEKGDELGWFEDFWYDNY